MELSVLGLWIIAFAWVIQLFFSWNGNREMRFEFMGAYLLGVALLVIDEYNRTNGTSPYQLVAFTAALLLLLRLKVADKPKGRKGMD
ncbi:MAG: hypothetical protein ACP5NX_02670 [Candidatus Bilamarchaeaceae archaeon]